MLSRNRIWDPIDYASLTTQLHPLYCVSWTATEADSANTVNEVNAIASCSPAFGPLLNYLHPQAPVIIVHPKLLCPIPPAGQLADSIASELNFSYRIGSRGILRLIIEQKPLRTVKALYSFFSRRWQFANEVAYRTLENLKRPFSTGFPQHCFHS